MKKEHIEFIRLVANGTTQSEAYRATVGNPKATIDSVKSKASNLANKYAKEIDVERKRVQDIVTSIKDSEVLKTALNGILSQAEVDKHLCDSISNAESGMEKLKAIDIYNKRFGSNAPVKTHLTGNVDTTQRSIIQFKGGNDNAK